MYLIYFKEAGPMLKIIGVILFLIFAAVSLAIRFRLTEYQDSMKKR